MSFYEFPVWGVKGILVGIFITGCSIPSDALLFMILIYEYFYSIGR